MYDRRLNTAYSQLINYGTLADMLSVTNLRLKMLTACYHVYWYFWWPEYTVWCQLFLDYVFYYHLLFFICLLL